jgi:hypothetical protein
MSVVRRLTVVFAVVTLGVIVGAAPASAHGGRFYQPPTPYSNDYQFAPECPGLALDVTGHAHGVEAILFVRGSHGQAFLDRDHYNYRETWKNTSTGKRFQVSGHGFFKEISAKFVPNEDVPADLVPPEGLIGPVYLFTAKNIGQPFIVKQHGKTVLRDRGILVAQALFDTLGDSKPGGTGLSFEITKVIGPHPGLDVDICELAARLTT